MTVEPHDHVRTGPDGPVPEGVYRVVGTGGSGVALLQVADERGRRVHSGRLEHVGREALAGFEAAENPDAGFSLSAVFDHVAAYGTALRHWLGL